MLSLSAFDELGAFLVPPFSDSCSETKGSRAVGVADDEFDGPFRVFLSRRGCGGGPISDTPGLVVGLAALGRGLDEGVVAFRPLPPYTLVLAGEMSGRWTGVVALAERASGPKLCLTEGFFFSLEGLSMATLEFSSCAVPFARGRDGRRMVDGGWEKKLLPLCWREADDRDGDRE
jgi:hypothetical protein